MSDEKWNSLKLDSIDGINFKRKGTNIFSDRFDKEKLGSLREKIMEKLKTENIKIKSESTTSC